MQTTQEFNSKYAHLLLDKSAYSTHQYRLRPRALVTPEELEALEESTDPARLFALLYDLSWVKERYAPSVFSTAPLEAIIEGSAAQLANDPELLADFTRVALYERAYTLNRDRNAKKSYPAPPPPPPPAAVRRQFVPLAALKAQPEPDDAPYWWYRPKEFSYTCAAEHALINSLIETLHEATHISHSINHLGDLDIHYTRKNGTTGEAYIPQYNADNYTPLFRNTLNQLLNR